MRNNRKWLAFLLAVVMLLGTLPFAATAAENESPLGLYVSPAAETGSEMQVQITASQAGSIADGKLVVTYDAQVLAYIGTDIGAAWADASDVTLSVNPAEGKIILAFASADAASAGTLFALKFEPMTTGEAVIAIDGSSYISDVDADLTASETVTVTQGTLAVTLKAGISGTFADGSAETVIQVLPGTVLTAADLAPIVPAPAYILTGWKAEDGTVYTLDAMSLTVDAPLTLTAQYGYTCDGENCPSARFTDISALSDEAHAAVDFMVANGHMNGMTENLFGPYTQLNRGMMVTILYRLSGSPETSGSCAFTDVTSERYYYNAVIWASENGITNGVSANLFAPDKALSRQELATFLYRFAAQNGYDTAASADLSGYTDADTIGAFAADAFSWAVAEGIIKGTTGTTLAPQATTTRAQVALMVYRLLSAQD